MIGFVLSGPAPDITGGSLMVTTEDAMYDVPLPELMTAPNPDEAVMRNSAGFFVQFPKAVRVRYASFEQGACLPVPTLALRSGKGAHDVLDRQIAASQQTAVAVAHFLRAYSRPPDCHKADTEAIATGTVTPAVSGFEEQLLANEGFSGSALVGVILGADGSVGLVWISKSSGRAVLDQSAIVAAVKTTYSPRVIDCMPVPGRYIFYTSFSY